MVFRMKICQINCVYGVGSTGKIVRDIHSSLMEKGIDSMVIVPMTRNKDVGVYTVSNKFLSYNTAIYRRGFGRQFDGALIQTNRIIQIMAKEKPDLVHLHCINGNNINVYRLLNYLSTNHIKTIMTLHAEYPYTGGCGHAYDCEKWKTGCGHCPILRDGTQSVLFDGTKHTWSSQKRCYDNFLPDEMTITSVSPWLKRRADMSPMLSRFENRVILNGCDTSIFYPRESSYWHRKLNLLPEQKIIAHIAASFTPDKDSLKGGKYIYQLAEKLKGSPYVIVVAANYGEAPNTPENLIYVGRTEAQEQLADLYSEAACTVLTSKRETFSMVLAESLCCGTPIVGFEAGGPESIAIPEYCSFVKYGNLDDLYNELCNTISRETSSIRIGSESQELYGCKVMCDNYLSLYQDLNRCK